MMDKSQTELYYIERKRYNTKYFTGNVEESMEFKETAHSENIYEIVLAENSYRTIHKLIKSGMWKMYCDRCLSIFWIMR